MESTTNDPSYQEGIELITVIRVGGAQIPFFTKKGLAEEDKDDACGVSMYYPYPYVLIDADIPLQLRAQTMFHELLHIISDSYGPSLREAQVCCLEQAFTQILQDNPGEMRYIFDGMRDVFLPEPVKKCLVISAKAPGANKAAIDDRGVNLN